MYHEWYHERRKRAVSGMGRRGSLRVVGEWSIRQRRAEQAMPRGMESRHLPAELRGS